MDSGLLPFALLCFTSFFTLTNPLGTMPVFLTMTNGMTEKDCTTGYHRCIPHFDGLHLFRTVFIQILRNLDQWLSYCRRGDHL